MYIRMICTIAAWLINIIKMKKMRVKLYGEKIAMKEFLLSKKNLGKLDILKQLLFSSKGIFMVDISLEVEVSRSTKLRYINELTEDLHLLFPNGMCSIIKADFTDLYMMYYSDELDIDFIVSKVRQNYIQEGLEYQVIVHLLTKNYHSANQMALELNISLATVYSIIKKVNLLLHQFGVRVKFHSGFGNLEGNEINVRFVNYFLFWSIFRENAIGQLSSFIPLEFFDTSCVKNTLNLDTEFTLSAETRLKVIYSLTLYRRVFIKKEIELSDSFYEDVQFLYNAELSFSNNFENSIPKETLMKEKYLFSYAIRGLIYDIFSFEDKERVVGLYQNSDLEINSKVKKFIDNFEKRLEINFSYKSYIETYYMLLLLFIYTAHINIDFVNYYDIKPSLKKLKEQKMVIENFEQVLVDFIFEQEEELNLKIEIHSEIVSHISNFLIWSFFLAKQEAQINICIQMAGNIYLSQAIKKTITDFIPEKFINFTSNPKEMDILISDNYEGEYPQVKKFFFENPYSSKTWTELIAFINQLRWDKRNEWMK